MQYCSSCMVILGTQKHMILNHMTSLCEAYRQSSLNINDRACGPWKKSGWEYGISFSGCFSRDVSLVAMLKLPGNSSWKWLVSKPPYQHFMSNEYVIVLKAHNRKETPMLSYPYRKEISF